jgi:hypothetical protein
MYLFTTLTSWWYLISLCTDLSKVDKLRKCSWNPSITSSDPEYVLPFTFMSWICSRPFLRFFYVKRGTNLTYNHRRLCRVKNMLAIYLKYHEAGLNLVEIRIPKKILVLPHRILNMFCHSHLCPEYVQGLFYDFSESTCEIVPCCLIVPPLY